MQQTGKGLVTLGVYAIPNVAECLEDQVQVMIFPGNAGNPLPEGVDSPLRPQLPGMTGDGGEMPFSIEIAAPDNGQPGDNAFPASALSQFRTAFWMDGANPGGASPLVVIGDGSEGDGPNMVSLDAAGSDLSGRPSANIPDAASSSDGANHPETGLPQGSKGGTSLPLGLSKAPPAQPPAPFAIAMRNEVSGDSGKALEAVRPDAPPVVPPLTASAPSPTGPGTGPAAAPPEIVATPAQGTKGTEGENPVTRVEGLPGHALPRSHATIGEDTPRSLPADAAFARPAASVKAQMTSPQVPASPDIAAVARNLPAGPNPDLTSQPQPQDARLSPMTGNPAATVPTPGQETVLSGTRIPGERTVRDSSGPFAGRSGQPATVASGISVGFERSDAPSHGHPVQGAGDGMSDRSDTPSAAKIEESNSIRGSQVSKESQPPAAATGTPKAMTSVPEPSSVSRVPVAGSGALASSAPLGEVASGIHARADLSAETSPGSFPEAMDAAQPGHSSPGDSLRRAPESEIRMTTLARGAASQIAEAVRVPLDGSIEVRLSPEELGRVRVSMIPGEAGLVIQLVAERPETLDLLRRHADLLAADLHDAGYTGLEFSFSREDQGHAPSGSGSGSRPDPIVEQTAMRPAAPGGVARTDADGTLDLRL